MSVLPNEHSQDDTTPRNQTDENLDDLLEQLDNEEDEFLSKYRDQRLEELSDHMRQVQKNLESGSFGSVRQFHDEHQLMQTTSTTERCVIHFFLNSFRKCQVMDEKLRIMAESYPTSNFFKISVEECPFLTHKLSLKVLPVVIAYRNGLETDRLVGFARLGNDPDDFPIVRLEDWLQQANAVPRRDAKMTILSKFRAASKLRDSDDDESE